MILFALVSGYAIYRFAKYCYHDRDWFNVFPGLLLAFCLALALGGMFLVSAIAGYNVNTELVEENRYELRLLNDGSAISGEFGGNLFVMAGTIDEELQYTFYQETEPGVFELKSIPADSTKVIETSRESGAELRGREYWEPMGDLTCGACLLWPKVGAGWTSYEYVLEVPQGSIGYGIKLDGE